MAGAAPAAAQCRAHPDAVGGRFRVVHDRVRPVAAFLAVGGDSAGLRHVRRRLGGGASDHPAAGHARCDARPGIVDQRHIHRLVQRAGRVLRRGNGAPGRPGASGGDRRLRHAGRGCDHGVEGAEATQAGSARFAVTCAMASAGSERSRHRYCLDASKTPHMAGFFSRPMRLRRLLNDQP
ncbi:hypothetical protein XHV734_2182 [Xanthomonas hortorum pv. vitians]|nr:hypothetical protein XHV734_2182 [Xanthomonas hortorum pv. vitians]